MKKMIKMMIHVACLTLLLSLFLLIYAGYVWELSVITIVFAEATIFILARNQLANYRNMEIIIDDETLTRKLKSTAEKIILDM